MHQAPAACVCVCSTQQQFNSEFKHATAIELLTFLGVCASLCVPVAVKEAPNGTNSSSQQLHSVCANNNIFVQFETVSELRRNKPI